MSTDHKAKTLWEKANVSFCNYQAYLKSKVIPYELTLIDLLHISNFKGGNASIHEKTEEVDRKLQPYGEKLREIANQFSDLTLAQLNKQQTEQLVQMVKACCSLVYQKEHKVYGFGVSYLSALLAAHFPDLIPILDRRILNGLGDILSEENINSQKQVKGIKEFYPGLIYRVQKQATTSGKSLRDIDQELFVKHWGTGIR